MLYGDGIHDETRELQQMLDARGTVAIDRPGVYLVSKTLKIHSDTRFVLTPGARLLAAPLSRCALIENEHFAGGARDRNIEIIGGIWDGNCDAMGLDAIYEAKHRLDVPYDPALFKGKLIRFAHVDCIRLSQMTVRNPVSYGVQIGDVYGFVVRDIFFDYNWHFGTTDGIHINGPARDGVIENLCGTTNDDMAALTAYDEPHAEVSIGAIENVYIHNISAKNGYSAVRLLSGEGAEVRAIHIDGIYGDYRHHAVVISNHNRRPGAVWFDAVTIENVYARKSHTPLGADCFRYWEERFERCPLIYFGPEAHCGCITLRNIFRHEKESTEASLFKMDADASIARLYMENIHQTSAAGATAVPMWDIHGEIQTRIEHDVQEQ